MVAESEKCLRCLLLALREMVECGGTKDFLQNTTLKDLVLDVFAFKGQ